jgi:hypothetical protein
LKQFQLHELVPETKATFLLHQKLNLVYPLSVMSSAVFLSTAGGQEVGKNGALCQAIILLFMFLIVL